jgi:hypothetical protein
MEVWDPSDKTTVLSQIKKAVAGLYRGLKGSTRVILPGILIVFYFFIFFLLLSGCSYFKKEKKDEIIITDLPPREFICTKIDCGDEDVDQLVKDEQNTIACIKLQPECKLDEEN